MSIIMGDFGKMICLIFPLWILVGSPKHPAVSGAAPLNKCNKYLLDAFHWIKSTTFIKEFRGRSSKFATPFKLAYFRHETRNGLKVRLKKSESTHWIHGSTRLLNHQQQSLPKHKGKINLHPMMNLPRPKPPSNSTVLPPPRSFGDNPKNPTLPIPKNNPIRYDRFLKSIVSSAITCDGIRCLRGHLEQFQRTSKFQNQPNDNLTVNHPTLVETTNAQPFL